MPTPLTDADKVLRNDTGKAIVEKLDDIANAISAEVPDELSELRDVNISSPTSNQALVYNPVTQKWENGEVSTVGGLNDLNDVNIDDTSLAQGQELVYNPDTQKWENAMIPQTGTIEDVAIASFSDGADDVPVSSLIVDIDAVQAGSGTPSPSHPRSISGWSSCNIHRSGINLWDEEWEVGSISDSDGSNATDNTKIRSKNYTPIKPSTDYFIVCPSTSKNGKAFFYDKNKTLISSVWFYGNAITTSPSNAYYIRFRMVDAYGTTYDNDISVNYPATDTSYHAYVGSKYQTYFEGLLAGTYGFVDLGDLNWSYQDGAFQTRVDSFKGVTGSAVGNYICDKYGASSAWKVYGSTDDKIFYVSTDHYIRIKDTDYTDKDVFKTAVSGVYIICELATPTTPTITQEQINMLISTFNANLVCVVFGQEVYVGSLNVSTGLLTITHGYVDLGTLNWSIAGTGDGQIFNTTLSDSKEYSISDTPNAICENYKPASWSYMSNNPSVEKIFSMAYSQKYLAIKDHTYTDTPTFKTAMSGVQLVYELATPITVQLTPVQVKTLLNANSISADTGNINKLVYFKTGCENIAKLVEAAPNLASVQSVNGQTGAVELDAFNTPYDSENSIAEKVEKLTVKLTLAEYNALTEKAPNTRYIITDAPALEYTSKDLSYDGGTETVWDKVEGKATAQEIDGVTLACQRCPIASISNSKAYASGKINYFSTVITFGSTGEASATYFQCSLFGASDFCFGNLYDNNNDKSYTITKGNSTSLWVFDGSTRVNANTFAGKSNMYLNLIGIKP